MGSAFSRTYGRQISINLAIVLFIAVFCFSNRCFAINNGIKVCSTCPLTSIQKAIEIAPEGATIAIGPGTYKEETLIIKKELHLVGESFPVIDGQNKQQIIIIYKARNVTISGLVIKDTGLSFTSELAGIRVIESHDCQISKNKFLNTTYGVYLEKSKHCTITENYFQSFAQDEASGGNGIHIWTGSDHTIEGNEILGHRDGIYLEFVKSTKINSNRVSKNLRYGLHFMFSNQTVAQHNQFQENGSGVAIMYSQDILMEQNHYFKNKGTASYGLLLKDINSSQFRHNTFADNTVAIYMEGSNRSHFEGNNFSLNGYGLKIMGNCENNEFQYNNFIKNTFDVTTNSSLSGNSFIKNYWSRYLGYDLDKNKIGDVPFRPVSLSSVIVESIDSSYFLIGSLLFDLLDFIERALPELTPETLKDEQPLMSLWSSKKEESHD